MNGNVKLGRAAARSGEWAQHFSNASCLFLGLGSGLVLGLELGIIIPTSRANLVLRVMWQCDILGKTPTGNALNNRQPRQLDL